MSVRIFRHARGFRLESEITLPQPPEVVFPFFADAFNLERLSPPFLRFSVLSPAPISMGAGTVIDYRLRVHGIPLRWQSVISVWEPPHRFVDEQRRGPYRWWVHEHRFSAVAEGCLATDTVDYGVWGGSVINGLFVARDLRRIFAYRMKELLALFNAIR